MKPTLGRIVHYHEGPELLAAIITKVHSNDCVNLYVFANGDINQVLGQNKSSVCLGTQNGTWSWPIIEPVNVGLEKETKGLFVEKK